MSISALTALNPAPEQPTSGSSTNKAVLGEEFTQFLTLLTAQVENQDPLTPLDSTSFVEQLATFSALEQQTQTNAYLKAILERLSLE